MTPTRKGLYAECSSCKHKDESKGKYPCSYSHKEIRIASGHKRERDFERCGKVESS